MVEKTIQEYNPTFRFQSNEEGNLEESSTINKHIFFLHYPDVAAKETRYSIGRTSNNDITIVDYTISKLHAVIIKRQHRFIIVDQGATNGTTLNMARLDPNKIPPKRKRPGCFWTIGFCHHEADQAFFGHANAFRTWAYNPFRVPRHIEIREDT